MAEVCVVLHDMPQHRAVANLHHGLRDVFGIPNAQSQSTAEKNDLHNSLPALDPSLGDFAPALIPETAEPFLVVTMRRFIEPRSSLPNTDGLTPHEIARFLIALQYFLCRTKTRLMPKYAAPRESLKNWRRSCPMVVKLASK